MMHIFVMGDRPADVPEDWVIDHANRNKLDNRRCNLRWVPISWNMWNAPITGGSKYKGVSAWAKGSKYEGKWRANFLGSFLGNLEDERAAGWAVARAAVVTIPWAETSDLVTCNFSADEIRQMKDEGYVPRQPRTLPKGVCLHKDTQKYQAAHNHVYLGIFDTVGEAQGAYLASVKKQHDIEWAKHTNVPITYDGEGHAVIALSGDKGKGMFTKVPERFWHKLTFKRSWHMWKQLDTSSGYAASTWEGKRSLLHSVVWVLINPEYVKVKGDSIDHIIPENTLDNREENLRLGDHLGQARNKVKRGIGRYVGVTYIEKAKSWRGQMTHKGVVYKTKCTIATCS